MTDFERALAVILKFEGGKVDDPQDPGGRTAFGITQRVYDAWRITAPRGLPQRDVWLIEPAEYEDIYRRMYWLAAHCDGLPWPLSLIHFDEAVNAGVSRAMLLLQKAVGATPDGIWGPNTAAAAQAAGGIGARNYLLERMVYYIHLDDTHPERIKFFNSWLGRLETLFSVVKAG